MYCGVKTNDMLAKMAGLVESVDYRVNLLLKKQKGIADDHFELLQFAEYFAPPPMKQSEGKKNGTFLAMSSFYCIDGRTWSSWPNSW